MSLLDSRIVVDSDGQKSTMGAANRGSHLLLLFTAFVFRPCHASSPPVSLHSTVIIYTNDTRGFLEACGCCRGQAGGLPRRATALRDLRHFYPQAVVLEVGNLAAERNQMPIVAAALAKMNYDAVGLGQMDLQLGSEVVETLRAARLPVVWSPGADLSATGRLLSDVAKPVRILGSPPSLTVAPLDYLIGHTGPVRHSGLLVALTRAELKQDVQALARIPVNSRPDLVLGTADRARVALKHPLRVGATTFVRANPDGKWVGIIHVTGERGRGYQVRTESVELQSGIVEDPDIKALINRLRLQEQLTLAAKPDSMPNNLSVENYRPADICARCHPAQYERWRHHPHARAVYDLRVRNRLVADCLPCHSEMFRRTKLADAGRNVTSGVECSACHGDGVRHSALKTSTTIIGVGLKRMIASQCRSCHNAQHDPGFRLEERLKSVEQVCQHDGTQRPAGPEVASSPVVVAPMDVGQLSVRAELRGYFLSDEPPGVSYAEVASQWPKALSVTRPRLRCLDAGYALSLWVTSRAARLATIRILGPAHEVLWAHEVDTNETPALQLEAQSIGIPGKAVSQLLLEVAGSRGGAVSLPLEFPEITLTSPAPPINWLDLTRFDEARRLIAKYGPGVWPGWRAIPQALLLEGRDGFAMVDVPKPPAGFQPVELWPGCRHRVLWGTLPTGVRVLAPFDAQTVTGTLFLSRGTVGVSLVYDPAWFRLQPSSPDDTAEARVMAMVHEGFHVFETDLLGRTGRSRSFPPVSPEALACLNVEGGLLHEALGAASAAEQRALLRRLVAVEAHSSPNVPRVWREAQEVVETIEGIATLVAFEIYERARADAAHSLLGPDDRLFAGYRGPNPMEHLLTQITDPPLSWQERLAPSPHALGLAKGLMLNALYPEWKKTFIRRPTSLVELLARAIGFDGRSRSAVDKLAQETLAKYDYQMLVQGIKAALAAQQKAACQEAKGVIAEIKSSARLGVHIRVPSEEMGTTARQSLLLTPVLMPESRGRGDVVGKGLDIWTKTFALRLRTGFVLRGLPQGVARPNGGKDLHIYFSVPVNDPITLLQPGVQRVTLHTDLYSLLMSAQVGRCNHDVTLCPVARQ